MSTTSTAPAIGVPTGNRRRATDVRRFRRIVAAMVLVIPSTCIAIGRLFLTDDSNTRQALDMIAVAPERQLSFAVLGWIGGITVVPAFLAAGRLARRRRPVLTTIALGVNLAAYLGGSALAALDVLYLAGARLPVEQRDGATALIEAFWSTGISGVSTGLFVIGHVTGAILMGLALRGSIHPVGWIAMLLTQPGHVFAFAVVPNRLTDALAWSLITVTFAFCAVKALRTPDDEWDLAPRPALGLPRG
jgi:hypothetical protein